MEQLAEWVVLKPASFEELMSRGQAIQRVCKILWVALFMGFSLAMDLCLFSLLTLGGLLSLANTEGGAGFWSGFMRVLKLLVRLYAEGGTGF